jgi:hypothetical protein
MFYKKSIVSNTKSEQHVQIAPFIVEYGSLAYGIAHGLSVARNNLVFFGQVDVI